MNAILKPKKLETIFDYSLTEEERVLLAVMPNETENHHIEGMTEHDIILELVYLFSIRNNQKTVDAYIAKLDPDFVKTNLKWDALIQ